MKFGIFAIAIGVALAALGMFGSADIFKGIAFGHGRLAFIGLGSAIGFLGTAMVSRRPA